jgi:enoyl-CoA hydratase/carnithine racemase
MKVERVERGPVGVITLNRPEVRNALDIETIELLGRALAALDEDAGTRAVVLTGAGDRAFCSGMDLREFAADAMGTPGEGTQVYSRFVREGIATPVVAAVNGAAVAGGFELVLACDLIVASEAAVFGIPEVRRGLIAGSGGTLLPHRLPLAVALELGLTGDAIDAHRALAVGLVNDVVPADQVMARALAFAERVAANSPTAVRVTKALMQEVAGRGAADEWRRIDAAMAAAMASDDAKEGARAFLEKRPPNWTA